MLGERKGEASAPSVEAPIVETYVKLVAMITAGMVGRASKPDVR